MHTFINSKRGFTLVQLVVVIVGMALAATVAVKVTEQGEAEAKKISSIKLIQDVQRSIYGDLRLKDQTEFGFVGDMGRLPATLEIRGEPFA